MAHEVSDYLETLTEPTRGRIAALYDEVRRLAPEATEGVSYGMPSLLYRGKGLFSAMSTKKHIGVYPYGNLGEFAEEVSAAGLGSTKGAVQLREGEALPAGMLARFVERRIAQIDASRG